MSDIDLSKIQSELDKIGMVAVHKTMNLPEFCETTGISESSVKHNVNKFSHLMIDTPVRKHRFNAYKVQLSMQRGNLCKS